MINLMKDIFKEMDQDVEIQVITSENLREFEELLDKIRTEKSCCCDEYCENETNETETPDYYDGLECELKYLTSDEIVEILCTKIPFDMFLEVMSKCNDKICNI